MKEQAKSKEEEVAFSDVSSIYYIFYDVDLKNDSFSKQRATSLVSDFTDQFTSAHDCLQGIAKVMFVPEHQQMVADFYDTATWPQRLKERDAIFLDAKGKESGWIRTNLIAAVRDENGMPAHVLVANQKVDDKTVVEAAKKMQTEEQLQESYKVISSLAGMYHSVYYLNLEDGTFIEYGQVAERVENVIGKKGNSVEAFANMCKYLVDPSQAEEMREFTDVTTLSRRLREKKWIDKEYLGTSGKWSIGFFVEVESDSEGNCTKALWIIRDIDAEKKEELAYLATQRALLKEIEAKNTTLKEYYDVIKNAGYGIWKCPIDASGHVVGMIGDEKWKEIFGIENTEMTPEECLRYFTNRLVDQSMDPSLLDYSDIQPDIVVHLNFAWKHPARGTIFIEIAGTKYIDADGTFFVAGHASDVTEKILARQKWENEILEAKEKAEAADKAKSNFLFNMSHDIRTPMNAIIGFTDLLEKNLDNRELAENYISKIKYSNEFLLSLINNVLEMARIESGKESLNETKSNAYEFDNKVLAIFESQMQAKEINFSINTDVEHPEVYCDATKVKEVFLNILSNSLKYTPAGGTISMDTVELPSDKPGYAIYKTVVSDNGIGMSKEFLSHLFESFSRERNSTESKILGTGLGLAIVKRLVDLMQGTIEVESEPGKGTVFTITLAHRIAEQEANSLQPKQPEILVEDINFEGKRVLLAEDNDLNAEIAVEILRDLGFEVQRAVDGMICINKLFQADSNYYDLVLMDIQMPNMNGYDATKEIRNFKDSEKANIPIVAMTANAFEEDKKHAFDVGMNGHLAKPINVAEMANTLAHVLYQQERN